MKAKEAVAIGGSRGSFEALQQILPLLPGDYRLSVIVVIHQYRLGGVSLAAVLEDYSNLPVLAVEDKDPIAPGRIYVCPANYHLLVERERTFALSTDPPVHFSRPAIDLLFESAARCYRDRLVGVLLSGSSADGGLGLGAIKACGGAAICQDPATALDPAMPRAGSEAADLVGSPAMIGSMLAGLRP